MMLKTVQFNDHLPLRLGAVVKPPMPAPVALDIDLSVRWVGDIMDDEVQVSDMGHEAAPQTSEKFGRQLFGAPVINTDVLDAHAELNKLVGVMCGIPRLYRNSL